MLIAQSLIGGKLDPGEAGMLTGVFHLHEQQARQVMTPAPAVVTVDVSENVETALRRCVSSGHTRLVVTEDENHDRVKGIVHANALAQLLLSEGPRRSFEGLVREAPIVPETKPLDDLLADLQRERSSLAVVIDEYGRTAGIVTVEDIIEEVVGEIDDETDPLGGAVRRLSNGDWFVRGHVAITDLLDYGLELPVDSDAYNSVGGFVFGELGRLPKRGDTVTHNGYSIRVESVRENRIEAVRIREREPLPPENGFACQASELLRRRASRDTERAAAELHARRRGPPRPRSPRRPLTQVPLDEPRSRRIQRPSTQPQLGVAARDGVVVEHDLAPGGAAEHEPAARRAREHAARRPAAQPAARQRARGGEVGRQAAQLRRRSRSSAHSRRGARTCRCPAGPRRSRGAGAPPCAPSCPRTVASSRSVNGCETKLCAQLHKASRHATLPGNRLAASAVEEERGRSWGGSTERTRSARLRGASRALSVGGGVR